MSIGLPAAEPLQRRSRASKDRMLACAAELFVAGGYEAVAISEVARRAEVAVGTIYGRFGSKDGLVDAVQAQLLGAFEEALRARERSAEWTTTPAEHLVSTLVVSLAELLASQAHCVRPIMQRANLDPGTAAAGKAAYERLRTAFLDALRRAGPILGRPNAERACESCFVIAYATFARMLGLGSSPDAADPAALQAVAQDLGWMCESYLLGPAEPPGAAVRGPAAG